jgi:recombination protein RecT
MAKPEQSKELTVPTLLYSDKGIGEMRKAVPAGISAERLARVALTAWKNNALLQRCTPDSFMFAVMQAAQLGLEVNSPLDHASLIPFGTECKLIPEYKGLIHLAHRSPDVVKIDGHAVRKADEFDFEYGSNEFLRHKPQIDNLPESFAERDDIRSFWAGVKFRSGAYKFEVMAARDVWDHERRYSKDKRSDSAWKTAPARMGIKTVIRRLLNQVPLTVELAEAIAIDEASERRDSQPINMGEAELVTASGLTSGPEVLISESQIEELKKLCTNGDADIALEDWKAANGYKSFADIPAARFAEAKAVCK